MKLVKRGRYWWYDYRIAGRRYRGSTGCVDHAEAREAARARYVEDHDGPRGESWSLSHAIERTYQTRWRGTRGESTAMVNAAAALTYFGNVPVGAITTGKLDDYVAWLRGPGQRNADATINRKLAALSAVLRTAHERGALKAMPKVPRLRESQGRIRWLTDAESVHLVWTMMDLGFEGAAHLTIFLLDTGLRLGEALRVQPQDVVEERVHIWETKADKPRTVPLTSRAHAAWRLGWTGLDKCKYQYAFGRACAEAGIDDASPHTLRHTCASRLVQRGVPLKVVQEWLGHKSISTTMRYAHLSVDSLRDAARVLEEDHKPNLRRVK